MRHIDLVAVVGNAEAETLVLVPRFAEELAVLGLRNRENTVMVGNFYKCDENANAPFGSWNPVVAQNPDFHRPECFGKIVISK